MRLNATLLMTIAVARAQQDFEILNDPAEKMEKLQELI